MITDNVGRSVDPRVAIGTLVGATALSLAAGAGGLPGRGPCSWAGGHGHRRPIGRPVAQRTAPWSPPAVIVPDRACQQATTGRVDPSPAAGEQLYRCTERTAGRRFEESAPRGGTQ